VVNYTVAATGASRRGLNMLTKEQSETMADVTITVTNNGPYEVVGPITLQDEDGNRIEIEEGEPVYLCRCGGSLTKPFCDGTHDEIGFQGAMRAVQESEQQSQG